jgi:hypothetical protein
MCYSNCPYESYSGECRYSGGGTYPCDRTPEEEQDQVESYADRLYDMYKDGEITKSQAMGRLQRFRSK